MTKPIHVPIEMPFALSAETKALADRLAADLAAHNSTLEKIAADTKELSDVPAGEWSQSHAAAASKLRARKLDALANEVALRESIDDHYMRLQNVDYPVAQQSARAEHEAAKSEVTAALVGIGFDLDTVQPDTIARHPRVKDATLAVESLTGRRPWHDGGFENREKIERAKFAIDAMRTKDLALSA